METPQIQPEITPIPSTPEIQPIPDQRTGDPLRTPEIPKTDPQPPPPPVEVPTRKQ